MNEMAGIKSLRAKKVLFVLCGFDLGGAERQALYFARHLKGLGCKVVVWGHHHYKTGNELVINECEMLNIPWAEYKFRWPCGKKAFLRDTFRLLVGLYKERPDIIIPYLPWPSVGCGLVWRLSPAKICFWGQRNRNDLRGDAIEKFAYCQVSAVICNAQHEVSYLERLLCRSRKTIYVVHNGIELKIPEKNRGAWCNDLGIKDNSFIVTMLANFRAQKDHPTLLRAWRILVQRFPKLKKRLRLVLAGAPQDSFDSVKYLSQELELYDSVIFPGQVRDVSGLLIASDIGVLATHNEGLPNAILEYMTCGLPVVATDILGNREALGDNFEFQLYRQNDVDDLVAKLMSLITSTELRQTLGTSNQRRAQAEFSIEVMCKRMTAVVNNAINTKAR